MSYFSENLKHFRKLRGYTQRTFAEKLQIKRSAIGAYEEGRAEPSISRYIDICNILMVSPGFFCKHDLINKNK